MGAKTTKPVFPAFVSDDHHGLAVSSERRAVSIIANPFGGGGRGRKTAEWLTRSLQVGIV